MSEKIKQFELDYIDYQPVDIESIPGISDIALDYTSQIGGAQKPEEGADVTANNPQGVSWLTDAGDLALKDYVDTAEILDGAIETAKLALLSVTEDVLANNAVTASKVTTGELITLSAQIKDATIIDAKIGTVSANKIVAGSGIINSLSVLSTLTIGSSGTNGYIQSYGWNGSANGFQIKGGSSPSFEVIGGTITGGTMRTASSGKRVQMTSSNYLEIYDASRRRLLIEDDSIDFYNSSGANVGRIFTDATANLRIYAPSGNNLSLETGSSSYFVTFEIGAYTPGYFRSTGLKINDGFDLDVQFAHIDNIVLANRSPLNENGSMYSDGTNLYVRLGGSWRTVALV